VQREDEGFRLVTRFDQGNGASMRIVSVLSFVALASASGIVRGNLIDFSDQTLSPDSYNNGGPVTNSNGFTSDGAYLSNSYSSAYGGYWTGFSLSTVNNTGQDYPGVADYAGTHEYAAYSGSGAGGTNAVYAVEYDDGGYINLPAGQQPVSVELTNDTYTALSMTYGDGFAKKFGPTDYFDVTLTGYSGAGLTGSTTGSTTFYLAQNGSIVNTWTPVNLSALGDASSIGFTYGSSDVGQYGINTPEYVALDDLTTTPVPEPASLSLLTIGSVALLGRRAKRVK
jgi:hypothetical protein